ncbi:hypothetical protein BT96DRAFT_935043 [Gymnopus androsaceus JB14]|uniref:Uncharacterized protein n=1 Tax=Gymnopus androsaceus JB14 TaxID=1447944 RepID=A0A6A4I0Q0_9AGAR|nr:hypothetical protein BT96DRAFT_935043 [Gymnopus androsaceus JB14]
MYTCGYGNNNQNVGTDIPAIGGLLPGSESDLTWVKGYQTLSCQLKVYPDGIKLPHSMSFDVAAIGVKALVDMRSTLIRSLLDIVKHISNCIRAPKPDSKKDEANGKKETLNNSSSSFGLIPAPPHAFLVFRIGGF